VAAISSAVPQNQETPDSNIRFRWKHIALPLAVLVISIILAAVFYRALPAELSYHFQEDSQARTIGRGALLAWTITPQFIFTLLAFGIVRVALLTTRYLQAEGTLIPRVLLIMGNMLALPQIILAFAMLDIFLYNAYQIQLIPAWIFACIVLVLGGIVLGVFFIKAIRQARRLQAKIPRE
jgi:uncharacterized membrane protein